MGDFSPACSDNMWEISNSWQMLSLFRAAVLGGAFCAFYDILRALRATRRFSAFAIFLTDVLYFIIISPITFCFLLSLTNGQLRWYIFFGITVGFIAVRLLLSRLLFKILCLIFGFVFKVCDSVCRLFWSVFCKVEVFFCKISVFAVKKFKKAANCFKKGLKK